MRNRKALCIGINAYIKALDNAVNDATNMHEILIYKGYESILKIDLNYQGIEESIDEFCKSINEETEAIIFYFAGHGAEKKNVNYLIPSDINDSSIEYEGYNLEQVFNKINDSCNEDVIKIIILDACRNDKEKELLELLSRSNSDIDKIKLGQVQPSNQKKNYLIAFATSPGNTASDAKVKNISKNSIYTKALLESFKNYNIPIEDMLKDAREEVLKESNYKQLPWEHSSLNKKFYLDFKSHHKYIIDIKEIPLKIVNDILFINETKYLMIGNSSFLYVFDIANSNKNIRFPILNNEFHEKKIRLEENDKKIFDLYNSVKGSNFAEITELAEKLDSDLSISDLNNGERIVSIDALMNKEIEDTDLTAITKSKNYIAITSSENYFFLLGKEYRYDTKIDADSEIKSISISDDEKYCAISHGIDITIIEIDSKNYYTISSQYLEDIYYVSFMPNSKDLLLCGAVENLELIKDFNTSKKLTKKISTNYYTYKIGFTPNRKKMITIHDKGTITVWDVDSLNIIGSIKLSEQITNQVSIINIINDGNKIPTNHIVSLSVINDSLIAIGTYSITYCLIDIEHCKIIKEYPIELSNIIPHALSSNDKYLVCTGYKKTVYVYSIYNHNSYHKYMSNAVEDYKDFDILNEYKKLF